MIVIPSMATYTIVIEKRAERELRRLPLAIQRRVTQAITSLADNPHPHRSKKLGGWQHRWRIRIGDYRVVYEVHEQVLRIMVIRIGHRRDVYR